MILKKIAPHAEAYRPTKVSVDKLSWGILRVIEVGSKFSIVIHPVAARRIAELKSNEEITFKEETGQTISVRRGYLCCDTLFFCKGGSRTHKVAVDIKTLDLLAASYI